MTIEKTIRAGPVSKSPQEEQGSPGREWNRAAEWPWRHRRIQAPRFVTKRRSPRSEKEPQPGSIPFSVLPLPAWVPRASEGVWVFPV